MDFGGLVLVWFLFDREDMCFGVHGDVLVSGCEPL